MKSKSSKSMTARERFLMDQKSSKDFENVQATSHDYSHVIHIRDVSDQSENMNKIENQNNKENFDSKNTPEHTTINMINRIKLKSSVDAKDSFVNGSVKNFNKENHKCRDINTTRCTLQTLGTTKISTDNGNIKEIMSQEESNLEVSQNLKKGSLHCDSNIREQTRETNGNEDNVGQLKDSIIILDNSEDLVSNGVITNGWPDITGYTVEQKKENLKNLESKINSELCISSSDGDLEIPNKLESGKEDKALIDTLVKEKKDSKVSRFVRMFNRKDTGAAESGERSSLRKNQSRVWGMCLQIQSPNVEGEDEKDCGYKRCELASIKSEPLIDGSFSDKESNFEVISEKGRSSSSFNDIKVASNESLDFVAGDSVPEKRKNLKLTNDKQNLLRNGGGRRSFDRPQRTAKSLARRSNTLEDIDDSNNKFSRSSKTLPATPVSGVSGSGQDSNASHPFYRRFYSHCMILPMMKRRKETTKKFTEHKNAAIVNTSPQSTGIAWQNGEEKGENVNIEFTEISSVITSTKREVEIDDSPRKLPVIDDLLAEIMENVTLMELEVKEDEEKLESVHNTLDESIICSEDCGFSSTCIHSTETQPTVRVHSEGTVDTGATRGNDEVAGTTQTHNIDSWEGVFDSSFIQNLNPSDETRCPRPISRVESLISKFEQNP
ncbi:hypothetical protein OTU49_008998 [Cherax quadricarinatus]|uniref:Uncharacterized protein n=1 Tax=Cherax quadricarinatus TaxID=27406 RepID=A0AAW0WL70_CHEQU